MEFGGKLIEVNWVRKQADKEAKRDALSFPERIGEMVAFGLFVIVALFFVIHLTRPTGFFTDEFGTAGKILLGAMLGLGMIPMLVRAFVGRRNPSRPIDAVATAVFVIGQLYFLTRFTFDFAHFADPLPGALEFVLDWISATLAKILLVLGIIGGSIFTVYHMMMFFAVKERLSKPDTPIPTANP